MDAGRDLATDLHAALGSISGQLRLQFASEEAAAVGFVGLATLRHLDRHGATSVTELARSDRVTTQAISLRLGPLTDAGLIIRTPDALDARRTVVQVTERGRTAVAAAESRARAALRASLARLSDQDRDALSAALPALVQVGSSLGEER